MKQAVGLGRELEAADRSFAFESLPLGHFADVVLDHPLQLFELVHVARLGELLQQLHSR